MQAIVAPNLEHFEYSPRFPGGFAFLLSLTVSDPKFARVHRTAFFNFIEIQHLLDHDHSALPLCGSIP